MPVRLRVPLWVAMIVFGELFQPVSAFAAKARITIVSQPPGANIEWNSRFVGTTPYSIEVEDYVVKPPRYLWSNYLNERIVLRIWKEGYLPKVVELTAGPFEWVNLNNTARKIYYVVQSPDVHVLLERDPRFAAPQSDSADTTPSVATSAIATGTGFVISAGYVATNYHVVRDSNRIEMRLPDLARSLEARIIVKDVGNDLAILKADALIAPPTPLAFGESSLVKPGQDTFTLGFPLGALMGSTVRLSTGTIDSVFGIDDDPRVYQISNPVQPGNSGGPLFNKDGQLIGVVVAQLDAKVLYEAAGIIPQNINFAVKASFLKNLIDTLPEGNQITRQTNLLAGMSREKQIEALTPSVVEITAYRESLGARERNARRATEPTSPRQAPSIEGWSQDQVQTLLGPPASSQTTGDGITTWYYDTSDGTLRVYFYQGRASLQRQSVPSTPAPSLASSGDAAVPTLASTYMFTNGAVLAFFQNANQATAIFSRNGAVYGRGRLEWNSATNSFQGNGALEYKCGTTKFDVHITIDVSVISNSAIRNRWSNPEKVDCRTGTVTSYSSQQLIWSVPPTK